MLNKESKRYNKIQDIYLRLTPGIEAHTHEYIKTGQIDSNLDLLQLEKQLWRQ